MTSRDQSQLADMVWSLAMLEKHHRSLDANAMRYLLVFQRKTLGKASGNHVRIGWREIAWAHHSESQEILVDQISRNYGRMLWKDAKESGMFMWMTNLDGVVSRTTYSAFVTADASFREYSLRVLRVTNIPKLTKRTP